MYVSVIKELIELYDNVHLVTEKEGFFEDSQFSCKTFKFGSVKEIKEFCMNSVNDDIFLFSIYSKIYFASRVNEHHNYFLMCDSFTDVSRLTLVVPTKLPVA
jgi:hypothetical protein